MKNTMTFLAFLMSAIHGYCQTNFYVTTTNEIGPGSITEAINMANQNPGKDSILFNIPGIPPHKIDLIYGLPAIQDAVVVDGSSQPSNGFMGRSPKIILSGAQCLCGIEFSSLMINARACEIYGIFFYYMYSVVWPQGYSYGVGLFIRGDSCIVGDENRPNYFGICVSAINLEADSVFIRNNFIGVDTTGDAPLFTNMGIHQSDSIAHSEIIILNNIISGGVDIGAQAALPVIGQHVVIKGNSIGITNDTLNPVRLAYDGLGGVSIQNMQNVEYGGVNTKEGNVLSGIRQGLSFSNSTGTIYGNHFGTNWLGTDTISNLWHSIFATTVQPCPPIRIGGTSLRQANFFGGSGYAIITNGLFNDSIIISGNYLGVRHDSIPVYLENGIKLWTSNVLVDSNIICAHKKTIEVQLADSITISNNYFLTDTSLVQPGIRNVLEMVHSNYCTINNNIISKTTGDGIYIAFSDSCVISNNLISLAKFGIEIATGNKITITKNEIFGNTTKGIQLNVFGNDTIHPPVFSFCTSDSVGGITKPFGTVEIFYSLPTDLAPQGKIFIGTDTADAQGAWSYIGFISDSSNVTATVTDTLGNTSEFSQTISTHLFDNVNKPGLIAIWPNPANDNMIISIYPATTNNCTASVFDMSGRKLFDSNIEGSYGKMNIAALSDGLYILEIKIQDNLLRTKFIVRR